MLTHEEIMAGWFRRPGDAANPWFRVYEYVEKDKKYLARSEPEYIYNNKEFFSKLEYAKMPPE